jgi:hypothetical protein
MSSAALIGLIVGLVILAVAIYLIVSSDENVGSEEDTLTGTQLAEWQQKLDAVSSDFGLAATRAAAGKWGASAAAILGVLTTVAVVAGPDNLVEEVGGTEAQIAAVLILLAAGVAAIATLLAGLAEQGSPVSEAGMTPGRLRRLTRERAARAAKQIRWSRILTSVALCFIVAAAGVAWLTALTGPSDSSGQSALVVDSGRARCGKLVRQEDGATALSDGEKSTAIQGGALVTLVEECPK